MIGRPYNSFATKTDGTLWTWGLNLNGALGLNQAGPQAYGSPKQIPGTSWSTDECKIALKYYGCFAIRTDGTLLGWGSNPSGALGLNDTAGRSSPMQIPGTTWQGIFASNACTAAIKTDGTLWSWGYNSYGSLGHNNRTSYSSPVQLPGTYKISTDGGVGVSWDIMMGIKAV